MDRVERKGGECRTGDVTACYERLTTQLRSLADTPLLLFGYASLLWNPDVVYTSATPACVAGFHRRLWQASPDHRGTPSAMGRVATLLPACAGRWRARVAGGVTCSELEGRALRAWLNRCEGGDGGGSGGAASTAVELEEAEEGGELPVVHGTVYALEKECARAMLEKLCVRERAGYELLGVRLALEGDVVEADAFTFSGATGVGFGAGFFAPSSSAEVARVVASASGSSGPNLVYFAELLKAMRARNVVDRHLEEVWGLLLSENRGAVWALLGDEAASRLEKRPVA